MLIIQPALNLHPSTPPRSLWGKYAWCPIDILSTCTVANHQKPDLHQKTSHYMWRDGNCRPHAGLEETRKTKDWTLTPYYCARTLVCGFGFQAAIEFWVDLCVSVITKIRKKMQAGSFPLFIFCSRKMMMAAKKRIFLRTNGSKLHRSSLHMWKPRESKGTWRKCQHNTRRQLAGNIFNPQTAWKGLGYNFPSISVGPTRAFWGAHEAQKYEVQRKGRKETFSLNWDEILDFAVCILGAIAAPNGSAALSLKLKKGGSLLCDEPDERER